MQDHKWKNRVILLFADTNKHPHLNKQLAFLTDSSAEVTERDIVVYQFFGDKGVDPNGRNINKERVLSCRKKFRLDHRNSFVFLLIGKDGGVKMREYSPLSMDKAFALIDQMPMRKTEMKKKGIKSPYLPQH